MPHTPEPPAPRVLNAPKRIWLQCGEPWDDAEFSDLAEVTWCAEPDGDSDVEYVRSTAADLLAALGLTAGDIAAAMLDAEEEANLPMHLGSARPRAERFRAVLARLEAEVGRPSG
jgi:hypothetical protein